MCESIGSVANLMRLAEAGGVGAPILAEFHNGVVYRFTPGEMLDPDVYPHDKHIQWLVIT